MERDKVILDIIARHSFPMGWYNIAIRLGPRGVFLEENQNLVDILENLVKEGLLEHKDAPGHPSGIYAIIPAGQAFLADDS
jgi:DNA-binding PadR family transcriptional regulator